MPRGRPRKNAGDVLVKSAELIGWAIGGLEREIVETRTRLASLTAQAAALRKRAGARGAAANAGAESADAGDSEPAAGGRKRRRRKMSPEARKRISEMMKKRWAERRKGK
jgi:hypothetical protein